MVKRMAKSAKVGNISTEFFITKKELPQMSEAVNNPSLLNADLFILYSLQGKRQSAPSSIWYRPVSIHKAENYRRQTFPYHTACRKPRQWVFSTSAISPSDDTRR